LGAHGGGSGVYDWGVIVDFSPGETQRGQRAKGFLSRIYNTMAGAVADGDKGGVNGQLFTRSRTGDIKTLMLAYLGVSRPAVC
jgi:hypothetical protein